MRLFQSLSAALTLAAFVAPFTVADMAVAQSGPPTSGWSAPGSAPQAAPQSAPPTSGWNAPAAGPAASAPMAPALGGWNAGPQRDCGGEFLPLREDAEKKAAAIQKAAATKRQAAVCAAFKTFAAAEAKVVKYVEQHGAECRIPPDALKTMKANHAKTLEIRGKVCDVAAAPAPRAPSLSDALGTSRIPTAPSESGTARRGGTFDTLTGNSLQR